MSEGLFTNLSWLPEVRGDFRARCRALWTAESGFGNGLRSLASFALDQNQLTRLAGVAERTRKAGRNLEPLIPFRLGILSNSTVDFLVPALIATAPRHGIALDVIPGEYDQAVQD